MVTIFLLNFVCGSNSLRTQPYASCSVHFIVIRSSQILRTGRRACFLNMRKIVYIPWHLYYSHAYFLNFPCGWMFTSHYFQLTCCRYHDSFNEWNSGWQLWNLWYCWHQRNWLTSREAISYIQCVAVCLRIASVVSLSAVTMLLSNVWFAIWMHNHVA